MSERNFPFESDQNYGREAVQNVTSASSSSYLTSGAAWVENNLAYSEPVHDTSLEAVQHSTFTAMSSDPRLFIEKIMDPQNAPDVTWHPYRNSEQQVSKSYPFTNSKQEIETYNGKISLPSLSPSRSQQQQHPIMHTSTLSTELVSPQQYSKEQWKLIKPIIQQLYVLQRFPFKKVIEVLKDEHDIVITRRQFYRKIKDWDFAKNIKDQEMRALVNIHGTNLSSATIRGMKVRPDKVHRWQRGQHNAIIANAGGLVNGTDPTTEFEAVTLENCHNSPIVLDDPTPLDMITLPPMISEQACQSDEESSPNWDAVDVIGSPQLSRLLEALDLESRKEIPVLSLDNQYSETELEFVNTKQLRRIYPTNNRSAALSCSPPWLTKITVPEKKTDEAMELFWEPPSSVIEESSEDEADNLIDISGTKTNSLSYHSTNQLEASHMIFLGTVQSFLPDLLIQPQAFPTCVESTIRRAQSMVSTMRDPKEEVVVSKNRLKKLKRAFPANHRAIIYTKKELGRLYIKQADYEPAERLFRQAAFATYQTYGPESVETFSAYFDVVEVIYDRDQFVRAERLNRALQAAILKSLDADHELAVKSYATMAQLLFYLEMYEESIALYRQVLQIRLLSHGPFHKSTIDSIHQLGDALQYTNQLKESEQLLRIVLQVKRATEATMDQATCRIMASLADNLHTQGRYPESLSLYDKVQMRTAELSGIDSSDYCSHMLQRAWLLCYLGKLQECEEVCRETMATQAKIKISVFELMYTRYLMAYVLMEKREYEEAGHLYENALREFIDVFGIEHRRVYEICHDLGICYEEQGRYTDALNLFQTTAAEIEQKQGPGWATLVLLRQDISSIIL